MGTVTVTATPNVARSAMDLAITFSNTAITKALVERKDPQLIWTTIRSGAILAVTNGSATISDYEVPLDTDVIYRVTQVTPAGTDSGLSATAKVASNGRTWLKDPAYYSRNQRLDEVESLTELNFPSRAGVFDVIDRARPVVVASRRQSWRGELTFHTATLSQRDAIRDLLSRGQVLLLATPSGYGLGNVYVHVQDVTESRLGIVTDESRRWTLPLIEVDRPSALATTPMGLTWADVRTKYPSWGDLAATGMTWAELLESSP